MNNPSGNKLEKLVFGMFDQMVEGSDKYVTKQGSTWLIFTEDKRWVVEFTKDKTLWFNYNLFQSELDLVSKDCTQERDLIKNWFESRFLGIDVVEESLSTAGKPLKVEDTIENGVKLTELSKRDFFPKDILQNGVRHTIADATVLTEAVEDTIQNGVRHTEVDGMRIRSGVKDAIQEGVKETTTTRWSRKDAVENTIQNGVKHIEDGDWLDQDERIDDIIQNGVKETREVTFLNQMFIEETIQNGVKDGI
jgi:predicted transcriptional regulator